MAALTAQSVKGFAVSDYVSDKTRNIILGGLGVAATYMIAEKARRILADFWDEKRNADLADYLLANEAHIKQLIQQKNYEALSKELKGHMVTFASLIPSIILDLIPLSPFVTLSYLVHGGLVPEMVSGMLLLNLYSFLIEGKNLAAYLIINGDLIIPLLETIDHPASEQAKAEALRYLKTFINNGRKFEGWVANAAELYKKQTVTTKV